jgi:acetyl esterase/lipase
MKIIKANHSLFRQVYLILLLLTVVLMAKGQDVLDLWSDEDIPNFKQNNLEEFEAQAYGTNCVYNVTKPTLTIYKPTGENSGKAVLIIPGGGYGLVAMYHEGYDIAKILSENGITAAVLKYRLPNPKSSTLPENVPYSDATKAMKKLRNVSAEYGFQKDKVGVMGFSAGSHLATVLGLWENADSDAFPNFSALIYGVTDLSSENLKWLEESLYYRSLTAEEIKKNTLLEQITAETPPAFLTHALDDDVCRLEESTLYAQKLKEKNVPFEIHVFPKGGHGFGKGRESDGTDQWLGLFINWLKWNF